MGEYTIYDESYVRTKFLGFGSAFQLEGPIAGASLTATWVGTNVSDRISLTQEFEFGPKIAPVGVVQCTAGWIEQESFPVAYVPPTGYALVPPFNKGKTAVQFNLQEVSTIAAVACYQVTVRL